MKSHASAVIVTDLGFGDQGKGTITDFLVRDLRASLVVRYNGGAQAAHRVVCDDGRRHVFAQFGAGTFVPGVQTFLSHHMAISPWNLIVEAAILARSGVHDAFDRLVIAAGAPVITPFHAAANRLRERARGHDRHGSCGIGVGETMADARSMPRDDIILACDLGARNFQDKMLRLQRRKAFELAATIDQLGPEQDRAADDIAMLRDEGRVSVLVTAIRDLARHLRIAPDTALADLLAPDRAVIFEGAQGVLLDEDHGFFPWATRSSCTSRQAIQLLDDALFTGPVTRLGVLRAYATRHGAGPLPTEAPALAPTLPEPDDLGSGNPWQGTFRVGWFDTVLARYAIAANGGIDALALTCMDRVADWPSWRAAVALMIDGVRHTDLHLAQPGNLAEQAALGRALLTAQPEYAEMAPADIVAFISHAVAPVTLLSNGPTASAKMRRAVASV